MALDRSVNRESNAFIGSILDGVVNTEGDDAAGVEVAFTLSLLTESPAGLALATDSVEGFVPKEVGVLESRGSSCGLLCEVSTVPAREPEWDAVEERCGEVPGVQLCYAEWCDSPPAIRCPSLHLFL